MTTLSASDLAACPQRPRARARRPRAATRRPRLTKNELPDDCRSCACPSMSSSQPADSRRQQRQDDQVRVAPYLTHHVTHHGQLTLIPPQNAGRIRRPTKKKKSGGRERERDDEEPRFTTAVPLSSSRKLHQAPSHVRTRKHTISAPQSGSPAPSRRYESLPDSECSPSLKKLSLHLPERIRPGHSRLSSSFLRGCDRGVKCPARYVVSSYPTP